jgi:hypothetical protein
MILLPQPRARRHPTRFKHVVAAGRKHEVATRTLLFLFIPFHVTMIFAFFYCTTIKPRVRTHFEELNLSIDFVSQLHLSPSCTSSCTFKNMMSLHSWFDVF